MVVLVQVQVNFSELYGMSLIINDIDPEFTIGVKELERQKTIERLQKEGLMGLQKELELGVRCIWLQILVLRLTSCVTLE